MSEHLGKMQEVGVATESSRGTAESSVEMAIKKLEANFIKTVEKEADESTRAVVANNQKMKKTTELMEGDISMNLHATFVGYLLLNVFGSVSTSETDTDSGVYQHDFTIDDSITRDTLTFFLKESDVNELAVPNVIIDTITISGEADGVVTLDFDLIGSSPETGSSYTYTYESDVYDFVGRDVLLSKADTVSGIDFTTSPMDVKDFEIEISTNGSEDYLMDGNYGPADIFQGDFNVTGSFTVNYVDSTFRDLYDNNNSKALGIQIQSTKTIQDSGSDEYPTVEFTLPEVYVDDWDRDSSADEVITEEVSFQASYNDTEATIANATVKNKKSGY